MTTKPNPQPKATPTKATAAVVTPKKPTQTAQKATKATGTQKAGPKAAASVLADVAFYRQRKSGTLRRLPYLAPGTPERKDAEKVAAQFDKGTSIAALAASTGKSGSSVRRMVAAVQLAREVEAGDYASQIKDGKVVLPPRTGDDQ